MWRTLFCCTLVRTINELHFSVKSRSTWYRVANTRHYDSCSNELHNLPVKSKAAIQTQLRIPALYSYFTFSPVFVDHQTSHPPSVQCGSSGIKQRGTHEAIKPNKNKTKLYHSCTSLVPRLISSVRTWEEPGYEATHALQSNKNRCTGSQIPPSLVWEWGWVYCAFENRAEPKN